ncbi:hypothetical protein ING2D1G_1582 [Peptoniphilus sp. ING2-D1G]|nr:hypothetical protein ING2D1G_1582 [Peptoniphilus sp. ING2-D1G]
MLDISKGKGFCTNGNAWSFIAKTDGGKYYYFKQYGTQQDADLYKHLYEISEEQYNISAAECFLTLSRKDGQSFELPTTTTLHTSDSDITGVPAGKTFTEIRFLHSQAYSYLLVNGDPTRATGTDGVIWSLNLTKDWVIEDTPGFGSSLFTLRSVYIHYLCEFEGNGHKLYRVDNNTETPLIMIEKPINCPQAIAMTMSNLRI